MKSLFRGSLCSLFLLCFVPFGASQTKADSDLLAEINRIKAIDNHSHVLAVAGENQTDEEGDLAACGGLTFVSPPPMRLRVDNPIYTGAWREIFGFNGEMSESGAKSFLELKNRTIKEKGDAYPTWILDKLNIETMLANRIQMGRGLTAPRFRWVSYADPLLLPFETKIARQKNSDVQFFYAQQEKLFKRYLTELKIERLPATLDEYLKRIVIPTLEKHKNNGSIAIKFIAAYYRSLDFAEPSQKEAEEIYAKYARTSGEPSAAEYKIFQDYVFRRIADEAARLNLVVHIHTGGGCGHFFNLKTANPILLEPFLNSPQRKAKVVLVHGGYPYTNETAFLLEKPNVYADFSAQTFLLSPLALSRVIKDWLEYEPEKVLFGTDASPATPEVNWEESAWLTAKTAREALAIALTEMIETKEITRARASELARMVLRENAAKLYGF